MKIQGADVGTEGQPMWEQVTELVVIQGLMDGDLGLFALGECKPPPPRC